MNTHLPMRSAQQPRWSGTPARQHVLVVGSVNVDLTMRTARLPRAGETLLGATFHMAPGGKGANQAAAAARLGVPVVMVGRVGDDAFGAVTRDALAQAGVDVEHLLIDASTSTGTAQIVVDAAGQNTIVVASGANACLAPVDLDVAAWQGAGVLVLQLEVPLPTITTAVEMARRQAIPILLNAAPAQPLPEDLTHNVDWLIVNEVEAEQLTGVTVRSPADAVTAARTLRTSGQRVAVTLGAGGAVLVQDAACLHIPAAAVSAIDTTAAGDAFVGALAAGLLRGLPDDVALRHAVVAGSLACTRIGAIPSLPTAGELARALACHGRHGPE